jgi:hypothetical protein
LLLPTARGWRGGHLRRIEKNDCIGQSFIHVRLRGRKTMKAKFVVALIAVAWFVGCVPAAVNEKGRGNLRLVSATYGLNCGAPRGNVTEHIANFCNSTATCEYPIDFKVIGDPKRGCAKEYHAEYRCGNFGGIKSATVRPEASGQTIRLECYGLPF